MTTHSKQTRKHNPMVLPASADTDGRWELYCLACGFDKSQYFTNRPAAVTAMIEHQNETKEQQ